MSKRIRTATSFDEIGQLFLEGAEEVIVRTGYSQRSLTADEWHSMSAEEIEDLETELESEDTEAYANINQEDI